MVNAVWVVPQRNQSNEALTPAREWDIAHSHDSDSFCHLRKSPHTSDHAGSVNSDDDNYNDGGVACQLYFTEKSPQRNY
jgi:hypothetical protein